MGLNSDERNSLERRFVPFDPAEEEDVIPNPPMVEGTSRGWSLPGDPVAFVPSGDSLVSRGAPSKRVSASRQAAKEDRLSRDSESFEMQSTTQPEQSEAGSPSTFVPANSCLHNRNEPRVAPGDTIEALPTVEGLRAEHVLGKTGRGVLPELRTGDKMNPSVDFLQDTRLSSGLMAAPESSLNQDDQEMQDSSQLETVSLLEELTSLYYVPSPATEQLVALLQALGQASMNITRNKHKVYSILRRSRDICNHILVAFNGPADADQSEFQLEAMLKAMRQSYILINALEKILLEIARVMPVELETFGPATLSSWRQSRADLTKIWSDLNEAPFDVIPGHEDVSFSDSSHFDDCAWFSSILHEILEPEIARKFKADTEPPCNVVSLMEGFVVLENAVKCQSLVASQDIAIDMATMLARTLSGATSLSAEEVETRNNNTSKSGDDSGNWLLDALADTFSASDRDYPLPTLEATDILLKWSSVRHGTAFIQNFEALH